VGVEPKGMVGLSEALIALRSELLAARKEGEGVGGELRFRITEPIELTFQTAVTVDAKATAGVRWWLITAGGEASRESVSTQTIRLKMAPVLHDPGTGKVIDIVEIDDVR
jgi:hypothetical protein